MYDSRIPDEAIFDEDTGETVGEAKARFAKLGEAEVDADMALALIKAGYEVWSFGYGDDPAEFTVVDEDDVEVFEDDVEDAAHSWGPFRFDPTMGGTDSAVRFLVGFVDGWVMSPLMDDVQKAVLAEALFRLSQAGIRAQGRPRTNILGISPFSKGG